MQSDPVAVFRAPANAWRDTLQQFFHETAAMGLRMLLAGIRNYSEAVTASASISTR